MPGKKITAVVACLVAVLGFLALPPLAMAQGRVNDKDMEALMRNLRDDAKSFQPVFNVAVKHSLIRKTSREKDARSLVRRFVRQTDASVNAFRRTKKADDTLPVVLATAAQINKLVYDLNLGSQATSRWEKILAELHQVSNAAGVPDPMDAASAPPATVSPTVSH